MQSFSQETSKSSADNFFANRYLPLTQEDESFYKKFMDFCSDENNTSSEIFNFLMSASDTDILFKLAEHYPKINGLCEQEGMKTYWNEIWSKMGFQPQLGISSFELARGMFFYQLAVIAKLEGNSSAELVFLEKAAKCKCFEAIWTLTDLNYKKLENNNNFTHLQLKEMVTLIEVFIIPHGTPVFLLLAGLSYFINKYHEKQNDLESANAYLRFALEYLYAAGFCEEYSEAATHNAFFSGSDTAKTIGVFLKHLFEGANNYCERYGMTRDIDLIRGRGEKIAGEKFTLWAGGTSSANTIELADECTLTKQILPKLCP